MSKNWLAKHPDLAGRFLTALTQAHRLMYQNRADTVRIAAEATGFNTGVIDKAYEVLLVRNQVFPDGHRVAVIGRQPRRRRLTVLAGYPWHSLQNFPLRIRGDAWYIIGLTEFN